MNKVSNNHIFFRLSRNAKISIRNASLISEHQKSTTVQPEHILVGILLNDNSLASKLILSLGFNIKEI